MQIEIKDISNKKVADADLAPKVFEAEVKKHLLHDMVVNHMANLRSGTHKTKGRSEVRGGGKKPWKQKGLGRARAGSIRSPIFRGGGIIFGPTPRNYGYNMPKTARRAALRSALSLKTQEESFLVVDKIELAEPKTKEAVAAISSLGLADKKVLLVLSDQTKNTALGFRNLPKVKVVAQDGLTVYDMLNADCVVCDQGALDKLQERLG